MSKGEGIEQNRLKRKESEGKVMGRKGNTVKLNGLERNGRQVKVREEKERGGKGKREEEKELN